MLGADSGGGITMPAAKPDALPAASGIWGGSMFGTDDDPAAARRKALARLLMNGGTGGNAFDPSNVAFRTPMGTIGATLANVLPAIASLTGSMFGGGSAKGPGGIG